MVDILFLFLILPPSGKNSTLIYLGDQFYLTQTPGALGRMNSPLIHLQGGHLTKAWLFTLFYPPWHSLLVGQEWKHDTDWAMRLRSWMLLKLCGWDGWGCKTRYEQHFINIHKNPCRQWAQPQATLFLMILSEPLDLTLQGSHTWNAHLCQGSELDFYDLQVKESCLIQG